MKLDPEIQKRIDTWLSGPYDEATKNEIRRLIDHDVNALNDAFFQDLSFGTGGMRGVMGVGTNRMNLYTIRKATQGLCNYLKKGVKGTLSAFIGYDVRHHSREFAEETARVFAGNGIRVFLSKEICPTPLVSFGCRHFSCQTAVMITASHNPPEYNGYKVYWSDGGQIVPPHDQGIMDEVSSVTTPIHLADIHSPLIHSVGRELDEAYLSHLKSSQLVEKGAEIHLLYTPLHGTGIRILPQALASWGYHHLKLVEEQSTPDGNFPNAPSPNPEEKKSLLLGMKQLTKEQGDLLIATDPDADRVGVVERGQEPLTGNQIGCLLLHHICEELSQQKRFPKNGTFIKTIVTSELFRKIALSYGGICLDVLTGFKYIGEKIHLFEKENGEHHYLFGAEESYGYLFGTFVRDKDAISTACLIAEMASSLKKKKKTLQDQLLFLYQTYGIHREKLVNITFPNSAEGLSHMGRLMDQLRRDPPKAIQNKQVTKIEDYAHGLQGLPPSNVLRFWLEDETKIVLRPSGTEPKLKLYLEVVGEEIDTLDQKLSSIAEEMKLLSFSRKNL